MLSDNARGAGWAGLGGAMIARTFTNALARRNGRFAIAAAVMALAAIGFSLVRPAIAHADVDQETQFVLNTFAFLVWGALVMWMCAGFTMLESGSVRTKNASMICLKNIGIYSIAGWPTSSSATTSCTETDTLSRSSVGISIWGK